MTTGPTGSGKSTTLYAMLKEVDRERKNVLSLEDPVEYSMEGVSQSQIHPEIDYTFATGLRTTLRQDPDVIMVGEIRDKETAQLAIQAALTGHLVFSTLHTNNVIGAIPRLIDMGVDPYLIAPTLALVMAQRLVRTLCPNGGKPMAVKDSIKLMIDKEFEDLPLEFKQQLTFGKEVYGVEQTPECPNGTSGRVSVIEVLEMDKDIEAVILTNPIEAELHKAARAKGVTIEASIKTSNLGRSDPDTNQPMVDIEEYWTDKIFAIFINDKLLDYYFHNWGFVPLLHVKNTYTPNHPFGKSDLEDVLDPQMSHNRTNNDLANLLRWFSSINLWGKNLEGMQALVAGLSRIYSLPDDGWTTKLLDLS